MSGMKPSPLLRSQNRGEGWVKGRFSGNRGVAQMRGVAPSPLTLSPDFAEERGSDRRALRARQAHFIGAGAGAGA